MDYLIQLLMAYLGSLGFGGLYNLHGRKLQFAAVGGFLAWGVYLLINQLTPSPYPCAFVSSVALTLYSELMARVRRCPVTGYLQVALLPLVPGAGIYRAMAYCVEGDTAMFSETLLHTIGFAAALSVGAMLASSVVRALLPRFPRKK